MYKVSTSTLILPLIPSNTLKLGFTISTPKCLINATFGFTFFKKFMAPYVETLKRILRNEWNITLPPF